MHTRFASIRMYCRAFRKRGIIYFINSLQYPPNTLQCLLTIRQNHYIGSLNKKIERRVVLQVEQKRALLSSPSPFDAQIPPENHKAATITEDEILDSSEIDTIVKYLPIKTLYNDPLDEFMQQLNDSNNITQLFDSIACQKKTADLTRHHYVQSVVVIWSLLLLNEDAQKNGGLIIAPIGIETILDGLHRHVSDLTIDELSCCYLYLRKMKIPNTHPTVAALLQQSLNLVKHELPKSGERSTIALPALSRLLVSINNGRDFHVPLVCRHFMPHLVWHTLNCKTHEDARLLAICFLNLQPLVDFEILDVYKQRIHHLLKNDEFKDNGTLQTRSILKIMQMLNMAVWSIRNTVLLRDLLYTLKPHLSQLSLHDLKMVCRIFQFHLEPALLATPLAETIQQQIQLDNITSDTLACYMAFVELRKRDVLVDTFKRLLYSDNSWLEPYTAANLFTILRGLKIADVKVCDAYWLNVLHSLDKAPTDSYDDDERENTNHTQFLSHCHRYMNFNNNLGGTYRHEELEERLCKMAMNSIGTTIDGRLPSKFSRLASFILAYGHTPNSWKKFPNVLLSGIIGMANQFSIADCLVISRGIQIATELRFRRQMSQVADMQLSVIDQILVNCAERHLEEIDADNLSDLNVIVRSLATRKSLKNSVVYQNAFNKYKEMNYNTNTVNSRTIRDLCYNLNVSGFIIPCALDAMFDYVERNHEHIIGETLEKILSCSYNAGYMPQSLEALNKAAVILLRDFEYMSGLSLVQSCLALGYFKSLPEELVNRVFCVKFIKRIEDEIQTCYSKATYPSRVQNVVMQLNRTVCLDLPETNVPWFQQNYIEAQLSRKRLPMDRFNLEVKQLLAAMLKSETFFRCNHTTPYGYQIDFSVHFDRNHRPIEAPVETTMLDRITKVAILLLRLDSFCENDLTALRGPESLKMKHLEMMGYKVLHINEHDWNSKYMNAPGAKANYLKCLLQISN